MAQQIPIDPDARAGVDIQDEHVTEVVDDVACKRLAMVNVVYVGGQGRPWVLIDTGLPGTAGMIARSADARFGAPPVAIVLTHGHFDHTGALATLADRWNVPVYAHPDEHPYLNGESSYPPPDPSVGGGLMSMLASLYPRGPVDVRQRLHALPTDGSVPHMPGWRWIHTPGHSVGHVSLWRAADKTLIAGDAVITTAQESAYAVTTQEPELHGPPMYFTHDWHAAGQSAQRLSDLQAEVLVTGHGRAMQGEKMREALRDLAARFDRVAVPQGGRFAVEPQTVENGKAYPGRS